MSLDEADRLYESGYNALQAGDVEQAIKLLEESLAKETNQEHKAVDRNILGKAYEKQGRIDDAIRLYEENTNSEFEGDHPYERLRIIYSKQKRYDDVVRVLEQAIKVFRDKVYELRPDRLPKLARFEEELVKVKNRTK